MSKNNIITAVITNNGTNNFRMKYRLYINADDFGLNESVNRAIIESFQKGYITSTTLMVNMPYADQAVQMAKDAGYWNRVGIHMNLFEGTPLNPNLLNYKQLLGKDGTLTYWAKGKIRFYMPKQMREEFRKEIRMQIERFMEYQPTCMHFDSHGHSHTLPTIWPLCRPMLKEFGFTSARISRDLYPIRLFSFKDTLKRILNFDIHQVMPVTSDHFASFSDFENAVKYHKRLIEGKSIEIMSHPIYEKGVLTNLHSHTFEELFSYCRDGEMELLNY